MSKFAVPIVLTEMESGRQRWDSIYWLMQKQTLAEQKICNEKLESPNLLLRCHALGADTRKQLQEVWKAKDNLASNILKFTAKIYEVSGYLNLLSADLMNAKLQTCTASKKISKDVKAQSFHRITENEFDDYMNDELLSNEFKEYLRKIKYESQYNDDDEYTTDSSCESFFSC